MHDFAAHFISEIVNETALRWPKERDQHAVELEIESDLRGASESLLETDV